MWPTTPAERHRVAAATFGDRVRGVSDWDAPTPVEEWRALGVPAPQDRAAAVAAAHSGGVALLDVPAEAELAEPVRIRLTGSDQELVHGHLTVRVGRFARATIVLEHTGVADPAYDFSHPFHLHGVFFQVLDRNGQAPPAWEMGWKDTVSVASQEAVRILVRFDGHTGTYMFHCHKLEHEDRGMMGHFEVVTDNGEGHGPHH